jgi:glyoxylase-like metal-dependent hydrolase (beta-lactamase superfamily II)
LPSTNAVPSWFEPGVFPVATGVHRIPLPLPGEALRAVNVYLIEDDDGPVLIDAGWSVTEALGALKDTLSTLRFGLGDIQRTLITHMHMDHYTLAVTMRRLFGTRVEVGIGERPSLELNMLGEATLSRWLKPWGAEALADFMGPEGDPRNDYELPDAWIHGPTEIRLSGRTLQAVPTPGHTQGHLVFADPVAGILFSGDHILPTITPSIGLEPVRRELCLADFLTSLQMVSELPDMEVLPAHGLPGRRSRERAAELQQHHRRRLALSLGAVAGEGSTAYEVAQRLAWTRHDRALQDLDGFNQYLAVGETAAHLDLLATRGELVRIDSSGVYSYRQVPVTGPVRGAR